jgi:hypothetical protein
MPEQMAIPTGDAKSELYDEIFRQIGVEEEAPEATEPPQDAESSQEDAAEQPTEESEQEEPVAETTEEDKGEEPWIPQDLNELAEGLGVDQDALKAIKIKTKVDGVESDVPLGEVIKNFQLNKALTDRSEALAHQKKALEQAYQQFSVERDTRLQDLNSWNTILETRLREQVAAVDWQQLREDDPAEYAAKRQEFTERIAEIESMKASMEHHRQAAMAEQQQAYMAQLEQVVQENIQRLPNLIPEYKDEAFRKKDMAEIKDYLTSQGFSEQEVRTVFDARQVAIARKAKLYDAMQKQIEPKAKQLKDKPKFVRPTQRVEPEQAARKDYERKYKTALKNQTTDDWVSVLVDRL